MLGWSPRNSLQNGFSPGSRTPALRHEIVQFPSLNDKKPVLHPPHPIVIGFELGIHSDKSWHIQASESPRSVLPRPSSPQSPSSALGSLLTRPACATVADVDAEKLATNVHAAQDIVGREHTTCGGDCISSDLLALFKYDSPRASKVQENIKCRKKFDSLRASNFQENTKCRKKFVNFRCNSVLSGGAEAESTVDEVVTSKSIFSAGSPILHPFFQRDAGMDFLSKCFRCRRKLVEGKDIFMYRTGLAFCSQECRCKQINSDECKHQSSVLTPCVSRVSRGISSGARATQPAFA